MVGSVGLVVVGNSWLWLVGRCCLVRLIIVVGRVVSSCWLVGSGLLVGNNSLIYCFAVCLEIGGWLVGSSL